MMNSDKKKFSSDSKSLFLKLIFLKIKQILNLNSEDLL